MGAKNNIHKWSRMGLSLRGPILDHLCRLLIYIYIYIYIYDCGLARAEAQVLGEGGQAQERCQRTGDDCKGDLKTKT